MEQTNDPRTARCMEILALVGDLWTLAIVMTLQESERRFNELQRAIPKANAVTLTSRLRRLEEAGIVSRVTESRGKQSTVYGLTAFGRKLTPIADAVRAVALDLERSGEAP
ncbi:winged helix-turn-helix transcriptional regulator [Streptomyces sp. NPDC004031]